MSTTSKQIKREEICYLLLYPAYQVAVTILLCK